MNHNKTINDQVPHRMLHNKKHCTGTHTHTFYEIQYVKQVNFFCLAFLMIEHKFILVREPARNATHIKVQSDVRQFNEYWLAGKCCTNLLNKVLCILMRSHSLKVIKDTRFISELPRRGNCDMILC